MLKAAYTLYFTSLITIAFWGDLNPPWSQAVFQSVTGLSLLFLMLHYRGSGQSMISVPGLLPLLLLLFWYAIQLVPLPVSFVSLVSPVTAEFFKPLLMLAPDTKFINISLQPYTTAYQVLRFTSFVLFYILTVQILRERKVFEKAVWGSLIACSLACFIGILLYFTDNSRLLWIKPLLQDKQNFGSFNYHGQFAAYVALILPLALFMMHNYQPKSYLRKSVRDMIAIYFNHWHRNRYLVLILMVVVMFAGLLLSGSRGGIVCGIISLFIILRLARKMLRLSFSLPTLIVFFVLSVFSLGSVGLITPNQRFDRAIEADVGTFNVRTALWETGIRMALDFPMTGSGAGTFPVLYPAYIKEPGDIAIYAHYAHNDYLETLVDGGLVAAALCLWFFFSYFSSTARNINKLRDRLLLHLYYGSLAGVISLLLHRLIDFHFKLSIIVGLYFVFMLGVHAASTHNTARVVQKGAPPAKASSIHTLAVGCVALMFLTVSVIFNVGSLMAPADYFNSINHSSGMTEIEVKGILKSAQQGVRFNPLEYAHHAAMAVSTEHLGDNDQARKSYAESMRLNPTNDMILSWIGLFLEKNGEHDLAGQFYELAINRNPAFYGHHLILADWLNDNNLKINAHTAQRRTLHLTPQIYKTFLPVLRKKYQISFEEMQRILPDRVIPHLAYAGLLASEGHILEAERAYTRALIFVSNEDSISPSFYLEPYHFYLKQGEFEKATGVLLQAVQRLPNDYVLHMALGEVLSRQQMNRRAMEHYKKALRVRPNDKAALAKIEAITSLRSSPCSTVIGIFSFKNVHKYLVSHSEDAVFAQLS
jgi:Tfp pilus assembly protein PilF/O-antigen ligase